MSMFTDVEIGDLFLVSRRLVTVLGILVAFDKRTLLYEIYSPTFVSVSSTSTIIYNATSFVNLLTKVGRSPLT